MSYSSTVACGLAQMAGPRRNALQGADRLYGYYVVRPVDLLIRRGSLPASMAGLTAGFRREFEVAERVQIWLGNRDHAA